MKRVLFSVAFIIAVSAAASAQSFTYYFPQIAVGAGWRTTIFVSNATAGPASGTITNIIAEAGVPMAIPLGKQAVFVDTTNGFRTGVAIGNPNSGDLEVHFELLSDTGQLLNSTVRTLPAFQHISLFTDELFPSGGPIVGRLQYWCTNPMVSVALRFSPNAEFTTLPPIAVAN
jgi:hypothetical protein